MKSLSITLLFLFVFLHSAPLPSLSVRYPCAHASEIETWKEPLTGMEFVRVPAGCVRMHCAMDPKAASLPDAKPREICGQGLWAGKYEVTRAQFRIFVEATGYRTDAEKEGFSWLYTGKWEKKSGFSWEKAGFDQTDDHPVVHVSWNDATAMASWLSETGSGRFRLLTEAEWHYACETGAEADCTTAGAEGICTSANVADRTALSAFPAWKTFPCEDGFVYTSPVGQFKPNGAGLHDMQGNVWEWMEDFCDTDAYRDGSMHSPHTPRGSMHTVRGGSWYSGLGYVGCSSRDVLLSPSRRSYDIGFRLLRVP